MKQEWNDGEARKNGIKERRMAGMKGGRKNERKAETTNGRKEGGKHGRGE